MKKICVIGSINIDLVAFAKSFPKPGETVYGTEFQSNFGGKGANQAVALGKLGSDVAMFGKVGDDVYGEKYIVNFTENNVNCDNVEKTETATGIAVIEVNEMGENNIIIIPGANSEVDLQYINAHMEDILRYDIFLMQLEIPLETVVATAKILKEHDKTVILDPAPAMSIPDELYFNIDYITPNNTELQVLSGMKVQNDEQLKKAGEALLKKGVGAVIAKSGKKGAYIITNDRFEHMETIVVEVIDTTAAGDSFNAGFAYGLANGYSLVESVILANKVGALSTTAKGAQAAMPDIITVNNI